MNKLCCMSLKTAGIVIGWLGVVGYFILAIAMIVTLANADSITKQSPQSDVLIIVCSIVLASCVIGLVTSGLLIAGTMKDRHLMLLPWLVQAVIGLVFGTLNGISSIFGSFGGPFLLSLLTIVITCAALALQYYIFFAIQSLYKEIREKTRQPQLQQTNNSYFKS